jgi:hypothetical protein
MRTLCRAAALLAVLPLLMGAGVYRWVDADGVVNFSQREPAGVAAHRVAADPAPRPGVAPPQASADPATAAPPADAAGPAAPDAKEVARLLRADCEAARGLLEQLTSRGRVRIRGADGVEQMMPEEERQHRIEETRRAIAAHCTGTASR